MKRIYNTLVIAVLWSFVAVSPAWGSDIPKSHKNIKPLTVGDRLPEMNLTDIQGNNIHLNSLVQEQPVLLIYYRGGW